MKEKKKKRRENQADPIHLQIGLKSSPNIKYVWAKYVDRANNLLM